MIQPMQEQELKLTTNDKHPAQDRLEILAVDVGAGTQDILVFDSSKSPENCFKLVLPSQTQIVAKRIAAATDQRRPLNLAGVLMGGGASSSAIRAHLEAGLRVTATPSAAATLHNNLERVAGMGVDIGEPPAKDAVTVTLGDIDLAAIERALNEFEIDIPATVAIAVQDHGYRPGAGNNAVRFEYLQSLIDEGGDLRRMVFRYAPDEMTRMVAVQGAVPDTWLMDTGAAAVLGSLGDPVVAQEAEESGAILINVGNMHTFATLVKGRRLFGLFEHHTGGITTDIIADLVGRLQRGELDPIEFQQNFDGHGAAISRDYDGSGPFEFVTITGPNRAIARPLGYHEAAPHGDMMLAGPFGLVEGVMLATGKPAT